MKTSTIIKKLKTFKRSSHFLGKSGNPIANQYVQVFENGNLFQSYNTIIAIKLDGQLYVTPYYKFSKTTSKYLKEYCGLTQKEIEKSIKNKEIILCSE